MMVISLPMPETSRAGVTHANVISAAGAAGLMIDPIDSGLWRKGVVCEYRYYLPKNLQSQSRGVY